uniref:Protein kinase domain-containing protein n=1 Tax=Panagrolaimus sp. PS1159 TaxID=55785 RepID=A0AC35F6R9_9BILA
MATKNYCFDDNKISQSTSNVDFRYCNLNLNINLQHLPVDSIQLKSVKIERNQGRGKKTHSWNKFDNIYDSEEKIQKQQKRNNIIKNGMISLEISCNPQKVVSDVETKKICDLSLNKDKFYKPFFHDQHIESPFEFIRQQDPQPSQPQVMNHKSSQKLLNPNAPQDVKTIYGNLDNTLIENFEKTKSGLHWKPKGVIDREAIRYVTSEFAKHITVLRFIDSGTYGAVSECRLSGVKKPLIIKQMKSFHKTDDIKAELEVFRIATSTEFQYIPKFMYAGFDETGCYCFIMENLSGGTLFQHILNPKLTPAAIRVIALHIAKAVEFLHKNHLTHGDLKAENIGLTDTGIAKLMDFGKSRDISKPRILPKGTYDAPEVLNEPLIRIEDEMTRKFIANLLEKDPSKRLTSVLQEQYLKVNTTPIFCPGKCLKEKQPEEKKLRLNKIGNDLIISEGLIRFPTWKGAKFMDV